MLRCLLDAEFLVEGLNGGSAFDATPMHSIQIFAGK
jgi:hypothetical protein